ncbi:MAG: glycosyltransferase family 2 protein [Candidatus Binatia bacterium]
MSRPVISVIMPCHNRAHDLARVLGGLRRPGGRRPARDRRHRRRLARDATTAVLRAHASPRFSLRCEQLPTSGGPAGARNRALELVEAPLTLFVGDDIVPRSDLIAGHVAAHAAAGAVGDAVLGRIDWPEDLPRNTLMQHIDGVGAQQFFHYLRDGEEYDYRHFYTSNVSIKTDLARAAGVRFDTAFPFAAMEDAEFAYRLRACGLRIRYRAELVAYHYHFHTIWSFSERQYRAGRMAALFATKHPGLSTDLRVTQDSPARRAAAGGGRRSRPAARPRRRHPRAARAEPVQHVRVDAARAARQSLPRRPRLLLAEGPHRRRLPRAAGDAGAHRLRQRVAGAAAAPLHRARGAPSASWLPVANPERLCAELLRTEPAMLRRQDHRRAAPRPPGWARRWALRPT